MERKTIIIDRHICDGEKNNLQLEVTHYRNTEIIYLYVTEYIGDIFSSHEKSNLIEKELVIRILGLRDPGYLYENVRIRHDVSN